MLSPAIYLLACLVAPGLAQDVITDDTFFYGQSPPVYPSPQGTGTGDWADAYSQAKDLVSELSREEKVTLTGGISVNSACSGSIPAIPRVNFTGLCLSDAGNGPRSTNFVSSWPAGLSVGASWNRELAHKRAVGMGGEFRAKGVNILLGPVVGPLGRIASSGRNWEGFSNDPYLCGALAYQTVEGTQSTGVITSTKHFIANEQETNRNPSGQITAVSSNIDDKTMHELYLWPFQDAVKAGTGNIMCSYNRVNNSYGCANSKTQNGLLKTELGFQGFVVTDWGAHHSGVATALAGLDMVMPSGSPFWAGNLTTAVNNGSVPESRLDDMATRILATWFKMKQEDGFPSPGVGMARNLAAPHQKVIATSPSNKDVLLQGRGRGPRAGEERERRAAAEIAGPHLPGGPTAPRRRRVAAIGAGDGPARERWYHGRLFNAVKRYAARLYKLGRRAISLELMTVLFLYSVSAMAGHDRAIMLSGLALAVANLGFSYISKTGALYVARHG
ncbi:hypothetical protein EKO27_g8291 [Xylaria grammica]|uniref:Beta-glucosidase cel3A n=1 Tax=Xylaria grammica TaxID=363999 RepID=A0A439CXF1_9PEZI|nr:hypothetical protein EKO27_g8291 [Xylaria grammica]